MTAFPSYWDFAPPPRVMRIEAREPLQIEIVRNSLGEVMVQTVHAQVSAADAALRARGINPFGPTKMIGEAQGLTALERLAADVARWNGQQAFDAMRAELQARNRQPGRAGGQAR